jgi:hypothetical protein
MGLIINPLKNILTIEKINYKIKENDMSELTKEQLETLGRAIGTSFAETLWKLIEYDNPVSMLRGASINLSQELGKAIGKNIKLDFNPCSCKQKNK